jgi:hypothetical protein
MARLTTTERACNGADPERGAVPSETPADPLPALALAVLGELPELRPEAVARGRLVAAGRRYRCDEVAALLVDCLLDRRIP